MTPVRGPRSFGDSAVRDATGRTWAKWFAILDRWDAAEHGHTRTAAYLRKEYGLRPWWSQAVTARYEWERGLKTEKKGKARAKKKTAD